MWWDDGAAEPEWFVDRGSAGGAAGGRPWSQSTGQAVAQLGGMFAILGTVFTLCYALDDTLRTPAPSWAHSYSVDMHKQFGLEHLPKDGTPVMQGQKRVKQYGVEEDD